MANQPRARGEPGFIRNRARSHESFILTAAVKSIIYSSLLKKEKVISSRSSFGGSFLISKLSSTAGMCCEGPFGHRMSTSGSTAEPEKLNSSPASDTSVATVNHKSFFCGVTGTPTSSDISRKNI